MTRILSCWIARTGLSLCIIAILARQPAMAEQRVALVIGNGSYTTLPPLTNPPRDAEAIAGQLRELGFDVKHPGVDLDRAAMDQSIREFGRAASKADIALVFYAGHGVQVNGHNQLLPVNAEFRNGESEQELLDGSVSVDWIVSEIAGAKHLGILILDACRDNPIAAEVNPSAGRGIVGAHGLAFIPIRQQLRNIIIAYSTQTDTTANDGIGKEHSPYAKALLDHLGDPGLDIERMFGSVRDDVLEATGTQQPFIYTSRGRNSFYLRPTSETALETRPKPQATVQSDGDTPRSLPPEGNGDHPRPASNTPLVAPQTPSQQAAASQRFIKTQCGSIADRVTGYEWYIGPDVTYSWAEANTWIQQLQVCGVVWAMPDFTQLKSLFEPKTSAGVGYYTAARYWPAHVDPIFSGIGKGSWVWASAPPRPRGPPAFNFNQGIETAIPPESDFTVRVFALRKFGSHLDQGSLASRQ